MSDYQMQIVHKESGLVVQWRPGKGIETDLIDDLCERVKTHAPRLFDATAVAEEVCRLVQEKGVGLMVPETKVLAAIRAAFAELPHEIRASAQAASMQNVIRQSFAEMIYALKRKV